MVKVVYDVSRESHKCVSGNYILPMESRQNGSLVACLTEFQHEVLDSPNRAIIWSRGKSDSYSREGGFNPSDVHEVGYC